MNVPLGRGAALLLTMAAVAACGSDAQPGTTASRTDGATTTGATVTSDDTGEQPPASATVAPDPATAPRSDDAPPGTAEGATITLPDNTTTVVEPPLTTATVPPMSFSSCAGAIPRRDRIALLVWPALYSVDWDGAVRTVEEHQVGGVILMEPEGWAADDVAPALARLDAVAARGLVVATDEEGGVVQRLSILGLLPSQQAVSEERTVDEARQLVVEHGRRLAEAGVDMALGPVVDVVPASGEVPLTRSRFFSGDPLAVAELARAYVEGWQASGVAPVLKHYPGHGASSGDTHDEAGITPGLEELEQWDLVPFRTLADTGAAVMVGHLTVPGLTDELPATQSERAVSYLRDDLGYGDALVMTDALGMQAVGLPEDEAAVRALVAGIDVVIFTATDRTAAVIDAVERAVEDGTLTEDRITLSAARVLRHLDPERTGCGDG